MMKHSCALHERNSPLICLIRVSTTRAYNAYISRGLGFFLFYTALIFTWKDSVVIEDHPLRTFHIKKWQGMSSTKECFSEARIDLLGMTFLWSSRTICQIRYKGVFFKEGVFVFFIWWSETTPMESNGWQNKHYLLQKNFQSNLPQHSSRHFL